HRPPEFDLRSIFPASIDWERHSKRRLAGFAGDRQISLVRTGDAVGDVETQTRPWYLALYGLPSIESFENMLTILRRDPWAAIRHLERHRALIRAHVDRDSGVRNGILQ